jgi:hypothetical protein
MNPASTGRFPVGMKVVVRENDGDDWPGIAILR